jgi:hypothetical protein
MSAIPAFGSTDARLSSCLSGSTGSPSRICSTSSGTSSSSIGPMYTPSTDAIGAMSHAPRHSKRRTHVSGSSPTCAWRRSYSAPAPLSWHEMFVHT